VIDGGEDRGSWGVGILWTWRNGKGCGVGLQRRKKGEECAVESEKGEKSEGRFGEVKVGIGFLITGGGGKLLFGRKKNVGLRCGKERENVLLHPSAVKLVFQYADESLLQLRCRELASDLLVLLRQQN